MAEKQPKKLGRVIRQYAALPLADTDGEIKVLLITSRDSGRWVLPKGWAEKGLSGPELAAKEAYEEAGVVGEVSANRVGAYFYTKRLPQNAAVECRVDVFTMTVERLLDEWPEQYERTRQWFTVRQATMAVEEAGLIALLLHLAPGRAAHGECKPGDIRGVAA
jgi:8-oxo-dGTP pyrophosphatase MutT (NUDIX family)